MAIFTCETMAFKITGILATRLEKVGAMGGFPTRSGRGSVRHVENSGRKETKELRLRRDSCSWGYMYLDREPRDYGETIGYPIA